MKKLLLLSLMMAAFGTVQAQKGQPPLVYTVENTGSSFKQPAMPAWDQLPEIRELPDPLQGVKNFKKWSQRRSDISHMIQHYGIGTKPAVEPGQVKARMSGDTLIVDVTVNGQTLTLTSEIRYPQTGQPPYALMIGTSMMSLPRQLFENRPIAIMNFREKQVNDYGQFGRHHERGEHNFDRLYPALKDNGAYSEWAWGLSRLIDGLQQLGPEVTKIDTKHIGVTGCSYAGKMALYCGAFDERVALTIAQEPGGGGAAAWRKSHESKVRVEDIDKTDYHWFLESRTSAATPSTVCPTTSTSSARWSVRVPCCCWAIPTMSGFPIPLCWSRPRLPRRCGSSLASATAWAGASSASTATASCPRASGPRCRPSSTASS